MPLHGSPPPAGPVKAPLAMRTSYRLGSGPGNSEDRRTAARRRPVQEGLPLAVRTSCRHDGDGSSWDRCMAGPLQLVRVEHQLVLVPQPQGPRESRRRR